MAKAECETIKSSLKHLYDHLKKVEVEKCKNSVPKLFLSGMDEEALWQQLELQNNFTIDKLLEKTSGFLAMKYDSLKFNYRVLDESENEEAEDDVDEELVEGDEEDDGWQDVEEDGGEEDELDDEDVDEEQDAENEPKEPQKAPQDNEDDAEEEPTSRRPQKQELDDDFFKLKELNQFLDEEDRKEMNKSKKKFADEEDDENGVDLFQDLDAVDEDEDGAADMKFADFFEKPATKVPKKKKHFRDDEEDDDDEDGEEADESGDRRVKFNLSQNQEFSDKEEEEDPDDPKSSHEERQERLKQRMERLEQKSIGDKPWQLKGEVKASSRPENSLLEEYLEFDSATRPAPLITEETTKRLDDIILQRIKDRAYDDVERKVRPSDNNNEFRKQLVLDQAKSKESLAQIYEKDYLDKVEAQKDKDPNVLDEEPVIKKEIREKMRQLMAKLDALSNYHFTPKPAAPEIKIITNTPAIEMEEAAPVAVSDATMLAPEEVKRPNKGEILGRTERSKTDKNRERRRKKLKQRISANKETASGKMSKDSLEKVTKARNVQKVRGEKRFWIGIAILTFDCIFTDEGGGHW